MVKTMHAAGIEVILDVVYNHTAEGNHLGPTLSFKGIDNPAYYRLMEDDQRYYMDYTGTGNSLNVRQPHSLQLIMDSLRYWVTEMHVDGFRFDLASTLAREFYDVDRLSTFFELVQQDPVVSQVKLIAEPWDIGPGGYQVGNFPPQWTEWNGAYRDTVRDFWRGEPSLGEFASRLAGSADFYEHSGRRPVASINFVTAHDGFTLRDLVSYNEKHNDANGEDNNDGESHNRSWNHGVEGPTDDPDVLALRSRAQRNFIATLLLSQGVPMLLHGDEMGRTQDGNNNTYAQDSEISWVHWDEADRPLVEFTAAVARLRHQHPTFRRKRFFTGTTVRAGAAPRATGSTTSSGCTPTADRWRATTGPPRAPRSSACTSTGTASPARDARRQPDHRRALPAVLQRGRRRRRADPATGGVLRRLGRADRHRGRHHRHRAAPGRWLAEAGVAEHGRAARAVRAGGRGRPLRGGVRRGDGPPVQDRPAHPARVTACATPTSTYRLQITEDFDLLAAARVLPYLHDLGADWVYLSPILASEAGQRPRLRRRRPLADRPRPRRRRRAGRASRRRRAGSGWACWSTSCPTTWAWPSPRATPGGGAC